MIYQPVRHALDEARNNIWRASQQAQIADSTPLHEAFETLRQAVKDLTDAMEMGPARGSATRRGNGSETLDPVELGTAASAQTAAQYPEDRMGDKRAMLIDEELREAREALARETARADAAIAEIVNEQRRFGEMQAAAWKLEESLAATRRSLENVRALAARASIRKEPLLREEIGHLLRFCAEAGVVGSVLRDEALAAPAAGEEGKRNG